MEVDKNALHAPDVFRIHGEPPTRPVTGTAKALELLNDDSAMLLLPFPNKPDECLSTDLVPGLTLFAELPFDDRLRSNSGMVRARQPQDLEPTHSSAARQDILDRIVQDMAHREHAGDIWRRDNNRVGRFGGLQIGRKTALLEPAPIPLLLDGPRLVGGGDLATHGKPNLLSRLRMRNLEG